MPPSQQAGPVVAIVATGPLGISAARMTAHDANAVTGSSPELIRPDPAGTTRQATIVASRATVPMRMIGRIRASSQTRRSRSAITAARTSPTKTSPARVPVP